MADNDNNDSLILEPLRHMRGRVDAIADDMRNVKERPSNIEQGYATEGRRQDLIGEPEDTGS